MVASVFFFFTLLSSSLLKAEASEANCPGMQCGHGTLKFQFPFQNCSQPGFEIVFRDNQTMIHFPSYGDLVVKSISYEAKTLDLLDPKSCVHEVFLNLNLSLTPFHYYYVVKNYTYLNCSSTLSSSFTEVPCLSGAGYHIYTVDPSLAVPTPCRPVKTVAIPFQYSPYLSDNSFGLRLSWDLPGSEDCEASQSKCRLKSKTERSSSATEKVSGTGIFIFALAVIATIVIKRYHPKNIYCRDEEEYLIEGGKLLQEKEELKPDANNDQILELEFV